MWTRPARVAVTVMASAVFVVSFWPAAPHWLAREYSQAWVYQADVLGLQLAASLGEQARLQPKIVSVGVAVAPVDLHPFRSTTALVAERSG